MQRSLLIAALALAMATASLPAMAQTTYSCVVGISPTSSNSCGGPVALQPFSFGSIQRQVIVDLNQTAIWRTVVLRTQVCNSSGWTAHIGDSLTNNGGGGDGGSTRHDAEAQALDGVLSVFRSDIGTGSVIDCQFTPPPSTAGCVTQDYFVRENGLEFDSNVASAGVLSICENQFLFDFPPYDEADSEDSSGTFADKLYVGLNRTYGSSSRTGTGVQRACFYLSSSTSVSQATISGACGF